jgi:17beta-estradiol 17-dehydrogenase / very-long-chain 3-oxoacyl-CoA reductase
METLEIIWLTLSVIGGLKILTVLLPWLYSFLFGNIVLNQFKYGYVLITGASDGIGKALAQEFARRGFNLLLVSRSLEKLETVKALILSESPSVSVEVISSDMSYSHRDPFNFYNDLSSKISNFAVSVLVNNVGVMDVHTLMNTSDAANENMIGVNIYPSTFLTFKLLPSFLERYKERKLKSLIINFSSVADEAVSVGMSVYSATKRFNSFFSEGLRFEYSEVEVATVKPGPVKTPLLAGGGEGLPFQVEVDDYVKALLNGLRRGVNHGHFKHKFMSGLMRDWPYLVNVLALRLGMSQAVKRGLMR